MVVKLRLVDFVVKNNKDADFTIQLFGLDKAGEVNSVIVTGFKPFFYIKVEDTWNTTDMIDLTNYILIELAKKELKKLYKLQDHDETQKMFIERKLIEGYDKTMPIRELFSVDKCKLVDKKTLYGFDCGKKYKFVKLVFTNTWMFNNVKNLWYKNAQNFRRKKLIEGGIEYTRKNNVEMIELYEAKLPSLLRFFHIQDISPSGWVKLIKPKKDRNETLCKFNYKVHYKSIVPIKMKETPVKYKICSFDIEASSSHGDFPLSKKTYRKLLGEIITYWKKNKSTVSKMERGQKKTLFKRLVLTAFGYDDIENISVVYPKKKISEEKLTNNIYNLLDLKADGSSKYPIGRLVKKKPDVEKKDKELDEDDIQEEIMARKKKWHPICPPIIFKKDILFCLGYNFDQGDKLGILDRALDNHEDKVISGTMFLPDLEGDKCTFIGSTFLRMGDSEPYLNHCVVLNSCDDTTDVPNSVIEPYKTEAEMMLGWRDIIQKEDPDIIIGYNIFGFDYKFMYERVEELGCEKEFMYLSRNKNTKCRLISKQIKIASGTHDLKYIEMEGRVQIDLYNHFRREVNLPSYKLDYVAGHFIGDYITEVTYNDCTRFKTHNLTGLQKHNFVSFELIGHSSDTYKNKGKKKFKVSNMNEEDGWFEVDDKLEFEEGKKIRWGLAKDDVTPHDIFRLTNEGPKERAIIAKYCFQDCNLVHHIFRKNDILTGFIEIANVCSVPISYIVMRGQGIKLLSFLAKECRKKDTFMPVMEKVENDGSYEGAICLPPKCDLYLDNPIAVVDYSSLYPSSMISENISHDSKVWTEEYDLNDRLLIKTGNDEYDNLPNYKYVDVTYDTYEWKRPSEKKKEVKIKVGYKVCRFAQFPDDKKAILPDILTELLAARKSTRKKGKYKTVTTCETEYIGLLNKGDKIYRIITEKQGTVEVNKEDVISIEDTYDDYMKNVFDKRQQGIKVTANSMYGQCGARTSAFYEKDIAASTTATGRKLLLYGKQVIEEAYDDVICDTKYGKVRTKSEVIYGDSVPGDEPLILRDENGMVTIKTIESLSNDWEQYENFKPFDTVISNRREKQKAFVKYEVWAKGKWNPIKKVIRHKTNKKIYRVNTHCGVVDVTEDHSLINEKYEKIKPEECIVGKTKLSHTFPTEFLENECLVPEQGEEKTDETLYECSTCKEKYKFNFYYMNGKTRGKQCKLCIKKRTCERVGKEFTGKLDKEIINIHTKSYEITEDEARVWGMFMGDGSCGSYSCPSGKKNSWALNNATLERLHYYKEILERVEPIKFKVLDTLESSGVYKLVPVVFGVVYMVNKYRPLFYDENRAKLVPDCILNASLNIRKAFFEGYYDADGCKTHGLDKTINFVTKNKITAQCLYYLATSIGYDKLSVDIQPNRNGDYWIRSCKRFGKTPNVLKKMVFLRNSEDEYVYDLETEHGVFACGVGKIEIFNTDSAFFSFNLEDLEGNKIKGKRALELTIELAIEAGKVATKFLKEPHDLEYEKTFMPFCLLSKKRYVGMLYEHDPNKCKRKSMGIVLKRRDNAPIVKDIYGGIIDILMNEQSIEKAVSFTKDFLGDIVNEKFQLEKLIVSKSLRNFYKNPDSIAHKVLADRIGKRDPGNKPSTGSRIPYVYIQTKGKVKLQGDRIENPDYVKKHKLKLDYQFYITNQIMKPVQQVFGLVLNQIKEFDTMKNEYNRQCRIIENKFKGDKIKIKKKRDELNNKYVKKIIFENSLRKATNMKNNQNTIKSFFGC